MQQKTFRQKVLDEKRFGQPIMGYGDSGRPIFGGYNLFMDSERGRSIHPNGANASERKKGLV